jgi:hypothetical protein
MRKFLALLAVTTVSACIAIAHSQTPRSHGYCFQPCTTSLSGHLSVQHVHLDDPKMNFDAYMLALRNPISVPESGWYQGVSRESHVQLEFIPRSASRLVGRCVVATGALTGAMTASDISLLVMQVRSLHACKT